MRNRGTRLEEVEVEDEVQVETKNRRALLGFQASTSYPAAYYVS